MAKRKDPEDKIIDAALKLAAKMPWDQITLRDVARAARLNLSDVYAVTPAKTAILAALSRRIDRAVLAGDDPALDGETLRDRLFDVLMRRFDQMAPLRPALINIRRGLSRDPVAALISLRPALQSLTAMCEAAGLDSSGLRGQLAVRAVALTFAQSMAVWFTDEGPDFAKTMADLDRRLRRLEGLAERFTAKKPDRSKAAPAA